MSTNGEIVMAIAYIILQALLVVVSGYFWWKRLR